jgi:hypothetical protein
MLVVDFLHEFELGVWKALFTHLIRVLYAAAPNGSLVAELDCYDPKLHPGNIPQHSDIPIIFRNTLIFGLYDILLSSTLFAFRLFSDSPKIRTVTISKFRFLDYCSSIIVSRWSIGPLPSPPATS